MFYIQYVHEYIHEGRLCTIITRRKLNLNANYLPDWIRKMANAFWTSDFLHNKSSLNFDGESRLQKLSIYMLAVWNNSSLISLCFEQCIKWCCSSSNVLQATQILSSTGILGFWCLPVSMARWWALHLNLDITIRCLGTTRDKYGSKQISCLYQYH